MQWTSNTVTAAAVRAQQRAFRERQYLQGYEQRGERNPACDAEALVFLRAWIASNFPAPGETNEVSVEKLGDQLAANPACTDPLVLAAAGVTASELFEGIQRLERAVRGYEGSKHRAYPKLQATIALTEKLLENKEDRLPVLDGAALGHLREAFRDGSFQPGDQAELGELFVGGWAGEFFKRQSVRIGEIVRSAGPEWQWLALLLAGEREIVEAWKARGSGYADTVSQKGWQGFSEHLEKARERLTEAWRLRPDLPLAPTRMMTVALGSSGIAEMRLWFDRAVAAQLDYHKAWNELRWGLRPRWHGDLESMLAFGVTALNTSRFDTDVPRMLFDAVSDLEAEGQLPAGQHLFGRPDIWPHLDRMYEGYLKEVERGGDLTGWRSGYATVAFLAGKHQVSRMQLEALTWTPRPKNLTGWGIDVSLMALEVAARTGPLAREIEAAEAKRQRGQYAAAREEYARLAAGTVEDARTMAFIRDRLVTTDLESRWAANEWVPLLPGEDDLRGWQVVGGTFRRLPDGALEADSGPRGHLIYSRARMGMNFEARGTFEVVRTSNGDFQGGLVLGLPQIENTGWYSLRIKHNAKEGEVASFASTWSKRQVFGPARLNSGVGATNTFTLRFQRGFVSAAVNQKTILAQVAAPKTRNLNTNVFWLGVGAYHDMNQTTIRYRDVQVRRLAER